MHLNLLDGECWWGGAIHDGTSMPYGNKPFSRRLGETIAGNQGQPLLLSSGGRWVWSEDPFSFAFVDGALIVTEAMSPLQTGTAADLPSAYAEVSRRFFPPAGKLPDPLLFTAPQYNTWIELMYDQAQEPIERYAQAIIANGYPPGVLMIDDTWQDDYGVWEFNPARFSDPRAMVRRLHDLGFKVMLWICPFVSPDSATFRAARDAKMLLLNAAGEIVIRKWWNGHSALLDLTNPATIAWFKEKLDSLQRDFGVDGFKFDAGDPTHYQAGARPFVAHHSNAQCEAHARIALSYPMNELRACWKLAGQPLVQRLRDKNHSWDDKGLASLMPNSLAQGMVGYNFICPDMIGGGEDGNFRANADRLDHELFVRYAQCSALFPMMQFSAAPWRVLPKREQALCLAAAKLHAKFGPEILKLAQSSAVTGKPMMRHLAYEFPGQGYERVNDQFLLGESLMVAPAIEKGRDKRTVHFPPGEWFGDDGTLVKGPTLREIISPLERLAYFTLAAPSVCRDGEPFSKTPDLPTPKR